jgi:MscS family membrane protein
MNLKRFALAAVLAVGVMVGLSVSGIALAQDQGASQAAPVPATQANAPVPPGMDSPRETMFTFLKAMERARNNDDRAAFDAAACLAPSDSKVDRQVLAEQLLAILDRIGEVKASDLPDAVEVARQGIDKFRYFPRNKSHDWLKQKVPASVDPRITLEKDASGKWVFSTQTVDNIGKLYDAVRDVPARYVADDGRVVTLLGPSITRTSMPGWGMLLVSILAGVIVGKVVQTLLSKFGQTIRERGALLRGIAVQNTAAPAGLVVIAIGISVGLQFIYIEPKLTETTDAAMLFLYIVAVGWFLYNVVDVLDAVMRKLAEKTENKLDDQVVPLVRKTLRIFLVIVFSLVVAQNVFGMDITGWLAGLGIAGLAISLAAQDSIRNLFGSITVFFDRPFMVGDWVKIGATEGEIEEVGFRSTRIRTFDDSQVTLPNANLINAEVNNFGSRRFRRWRAAINLKNDTTPQQMLAFTAGIRELIRNHPYTRKEGYEVWVNNILAGAYEVVVSVGFDVTDGTTEFRERERLVMDISRLARSLEIYLPGQTVPAAPAEGAVVQESVKTEWAAEEAAARLRGVEAARGISPAGGWEKGKPAPGKLPEL